MLVFTCTFSGHLNLHNPNSFKSLCVTEGQSPSLVTVDGGRYDVDIGERVRRPVYWDESDSHVRRCSWFYRSEADSRMVPYEEDFAERLEVCFLFSVLAKRLADTSISQLTYFVLTSN